MRLKWACVCAVTVFLHTAFAVSEANDISRVQQVSNTFRNIVKTVKPSVVYIEVYKDSNGALYSSSSKSSGSGVVVDAKRGFVLTAFHVIENVSQVKIRLAGGEEVQGSDIRGDMQTDIALVKIDANNLVEAHLGNSDEIEVGDWVLAIGSPFGAALENSVSAGIVSAKGRRTNVLGRMGIENYIQTDAVINKGNSGGPLVNIRGEVIGINSNIISSTGMYAGLGFAVPSNMVKPVVERLISEGKVIRGWLGVVIASLSEVKGEIPEESISSGGVYVVDTIEGGPGEKGGLRKGDIIMSVDGKAVKDSFDLINDVSWKRPGQTANCRILRDGNSVILPVKLGQRPESQESRAKAVEVEGQMPSLRKLGISVADLDMQISKGQDVSRVKAAIVLKIEAGSIAHDYNIEVGDIITRINQRSVESANDFRRIISETDFSKGLCLTILNSSGENTIVIRFR